MEGSRTGVSMTPEEWAFEAVERFRLQLKDWNDYGVKKTLLAAQETASDLLRYSRNGSMRRDTQVNPYSEYSAYKLLKFLSEAQAESLKALLTEAHERGVSNRTIGLLRTCLEREQQRRAAQHKRENKREHCQHHPSIPERRHF